MTELFGIPVGTMLAVLLVVVGLAGGVVAVLALRNRVLLRLGVRNLRRRPARTVLIVTGLMLGTTIISAALTTGDTMSHTIRVTATKALGDTDVVVSARGAASDLPGELGAASGIGWFPAAQADEMEAALRGSGLVDGVMPAVLEQVAVQAPRTRQTEPSVNMLGADPTRMEGLGRLTSTTGGVERTVGELGPAEVFLNGEAGEGLSIRAGDRVVMYASGVPRTMTVKDVVEYDGAGTADAALLVPLAEAQSILDHPGQVRHLLVSIDGTGTGPAGRSDPVLEVLRPFEAKYQLEAVAMKRDALEAADEAGNAFMAFFTTFGSFSIAAGILLIFLIFVMLAAERRAELGIARAVGTRRGHLVEMFVFEGLGYDLIAAAVGAMLGAAVAYGMVLMMAAAFGASDEDAGLQVSYALTPRSLVIAAMLGVLITLVVVAFSALRVSRMTISTAIRNAGEPPVRHRRRRFALAVIGLVFAGLLVMSGLSGSVATPLLLGVSLGIVSLVPFLQALGLSDRLAFSLCGTGILVLWLMPWSWWEGAFGQLRMDFSTWITAGLMVVIGAVWLIMFNAAALLGAVSRTLGRIRALAPVLRISMAYPLAGKFRTGTTLAMFMLVVFTLVTGSVTSGSFQQTFSNVDTFGGGYDVRAGTGAAAPITDVRAAIADAPGLRAADFTATGSQSVVALDAAQVGTDRTPETYMARGLDQAFLEHTTFGFAATARGYHTGRDVWNALASTPGLGVVDGLVVPRRDNFNFGAAGTDFRLSGFYVDDGTFDPIPVRVTDPQTGRQTTVTVIGVLSDSAPLEMLGLSTSQATLERAFPGRVAPTIHYFQLAPGVEATATASALESAFLSNGMEAESIAKVAQDAVAANRLFNRLIQGFMGLGLVVGVAALGVITARAVVERRQQIGVLRAIGFRRGMVQLAFLMESGFLALTAIVVGTGLGLLMAYEIIRDQRTQPSWQDLPFVVPWLNLSVIFAAVFAVALGATLAPAVRASRVRPAEALRYQ